MNDVSHPGRAQDREYYVDEREPNLYTVLAEKRFSPGGFVEEPFIYPAPPPPKIIGGYNEAKRAELLDKFRKKRRNRVYNRVLYRNKARHRPKQRRVAQRKLGQWDFCQILQVLLTGSFCEPCQSRNS
mmetsp:Transcript_28792/g.46583  ORF Transcript_28792/g.46583 Transcript_28792/m.46583 type:complete len:128 (+) Transcript_28792:346-729(+)